MSIVDAFEYLLHLHKPRRAASALDAHASVMQLQADYVLSEQVTVKVDSL